MREGEVIRLNKDVKKKTNRKRNTDVPTHTTEKIKVISLLLAECLSEISAFMLP